MLVPLANIVGVGYLLLIVNYHSTISYFYIFYQFLYGFNLVIILYFVYNLLFLINIKLNLLFFNLTIKLLLFFRKNLYTSFNRFYFTVKEVNHVNKPA